MSRSALHSSSHHTPAASVATPCPAPPDHALPETTSLPSLHRSSSRVRASASHHTRCTLATPPPTTPPDPLPTSLCPPNSPTPSAMSSAICHTPWRATWQVAVTRGLDGSCTFYNGSSSGHGTSFFLEPHKELVTMKWSLDHGPGTMEVDKIDRRAQYSSPPPQPQPPPTPQPPPAMPPPPSPPSSGESGTPTPTELPPSPRTPTPPHHAGMVPSLARCAPPRTARFQS
jgi:hypothetical protein